MMRFPTRALPLALLLLLAAGPGSAGVEKASQYYEDAVVRLERKDVSGAIIQLKNALQEDPKFLAAQVLLGRAFVQNSQPDAAQDVLERALKLGIAADEVVVPLAQAMLKLGQAQAVIDRFPPDSFQADKRVDLLVIRGQAYKMNANPSAARQAFEDALALNPKSTEALLSLAELHASMLQFTEGMRLVERAIANAPDNPRVWYVKGTIHHQSGEDPAALEAYGKTLSIAPAYADARVARTALLLEKGRDKEVSSDIEYMKSNHVDDPRCNYLRSVYLARQGDSEGTRDALAAAGRTLAPLSPEAMKKRLPEYLLLGGMVFHGLNEHQRAQSYLEAFLSVAPGHVGARKVLGAILIARGDFVNAVKVLESARQRVPGDAQVLALLGDAYLGRRRPDAAADVLKKAMASGNDNPNVEASLGISLMQVGQVETGVQHLRAAFDRNPSRVGAATALAMHYLAHKEPRKAVEVSNKALQRHPDDPAMLNLAGIALAASGDFKAARTSYEKAIRTRGGFPSALLNLARLDMEEGKFDAARARLADHLRQEPKSLQGMHEFARLELRAGRRQEAIGWLEKAYSTNSGYRPVALDLIDIHIANRNPAKALEIARALESRAPEDLDILSVVARTLTAAGDSKSSSNVLAKMTRLAKFDPVRQTQIAELQFAAGNASGAGYSLDKALSDNPSYLPARALYADLEVSQGDLAGAEKRGAGLIKSNPESPEGYRVLGDVAYRQGRLDEAEKYYRDALSRGQTTALTLRVAGAMLRSAKPERGLEFMESWRTRHPKDVVVARAVAEAYMRLGKFSQARTRFESLAALTPGDATVWNNLANCLAALGEGVKAQAVAEKALGLAPDDPAIRDTLGWLMIRGGSLDGGLRHLREARLRDPRNPEIRYHLAAALSRMGREQEARAELREVLGGNMDFPEAADARALGKKLAPL